MPIGKVNLTTGRFRIRRGEVEVEFEGEMPVVEKRFEEIFSRVIQTPIPEIKEEVRIEEERRAVKRTGEARAIRERVLALKNEVFFKAPRELSEIRKEMQTRGWYHRSDSIQSVLLKQGAELGIKRIQEAGKYKYVEI